MNSDDSGREKKETPLYITSLKAKDFSKSKSNKELLRTYSMKKKTSFLK